MIRVHRDPGEGAVVYFGQRPGAPYVGVGLGVTGWEVRGGKARWFCRPTVHFGRLFASGGREWAAERKTLPAWLVDAWRRRR